MDEQSNDFMSGRYVLNNSKGTGDVSNEGSIEANNVALAGANIENSGTIRAKAGTVSLASGETMTVDFTGDGLMRFATDSITTKETSIENSGSIEAGEVSLSIATANDVFSGVINTTGIITAQRADGTGGRVSLKAKEIKQSGSINTDGTTGGEVTITADRKVTIEGGITAKGTGNTKQATGGKITATADTTEVKATASIDASGETGGGEVLIGGGWQGQDKSIRNAKTTDVEKGATIKANANTTGDGGTIVVWSDNTTTYYGDIEARGGKKEGNGGKAEVSGKEHLLMRGTADLRATNGETGTLLLDPGTVSICYGADAGCTASRMDTFTDDGIQTMLMSANVDIETSAASTGDEDINIEDDVSITWSANSLNLNAGNNINLNGSTLDASGGGTLALTFGNMLSLGSATLSGTITATGDGSSSTLVGPTGNTAWTINGGSVTVGGVDVSMVNQLQGGAGVDTFSIAANSNSDYTILGGDGSDILTYAGTDWDINGSTVTLGATMATQSTLTLTAIETLQGGTGANTFTFNGTNAFSGTIDGTASSSNRFLFQGSGAISSTIDGSAGADSFFLESNNFTGTINAGAGTDTFNILAGNISGTINGDGGNDTFNVDDQGASITGTISGGADSDTLNFGEVTSISYNGVSGNLTITLDGNANNGSVGDGFAITSFTGIDTITGGTGTDTIAGLEAVAAWTPTSYSDGTNTLMFSSVETFQGNSMADTLNLSSVTDALTIELTGTPDANGFAANVSRTADMMAFSISSFTNMDTITGGTMTDTLEGLDVAATWTPTSYSDGANTLTLSSVETFKGGSMADKLDLSTAGSKLRITLSDDLGTDDGFASTAITGAGISGFDNMNEIIGRTGTGDALHGPSIAAAGTWTLGDTDSYEVSSRTLMFSNMDDITGGGGNDTYTISTHTGDISDLAGTNEFNLNGTVDGDLTGGINADTFNMNNGGSVTGMISGGAGNDIFNLKTGGSVTGTIDGGDGSDTLSYAGRSDMVTVAIATCDPSCADGFSGTTATDVGTALAADAIKFLNIDTVTGSTAIDDSFAVATTATLSGTQYTEGSYTLTVNSFEDLDTPRIMGTNDATTWTITGDTVVQDVGGVETTFTGVTSITGGSMVDTFVINADTAITLDGGAGDDVFRLAATVDITGYIEGGGGDGDMLDLTAIIADLTVDLTGTINRLGSPSVAASRGFTGNGVSDGMGDMRVSSFGGINDIRGGTGSNTIMGINNTAGTWNIGTMADTTSTSYVSNLHILALSSFSTFTPRGNGVDIFNIWRAYTGSLDGGAGNDIFNLENNGSVMGNITGGAGADMFNLKSGGSVTGDITGGAGADVFTLAGAVTGSLSGEGGDDRFTLDSGGSVSMGISGGVDADTFTLNSGGSVSMGITGGVGEDTFDFNGGTVSGTVDGGADGDTLDFSMLPDGLTVTLTDATAPDADGFDGTVIGGATVTFSGMNIVNGGSGLDSFAGRNQNATWTTTTYSEDSTTYILTFSSFRTLTGGSGDDTFEGSNVDATWEINPTGSSITYSNVPDGAITLLGMDMLQGGTMTDTVDKADFAMPDDVVVTWTPTSYRHVDGTNPAVSYMLSNMEIFQGSNAADTLDLSTVDDGLTIALTGTPDANGFDGNVSRTDGMAFPISSFTKMNIITGGSGDDTLTGLDAVAEWTLGDMDSYTSGGQTLMFSALENIQGGNDADTFTVNGAHTGNIMGGAGDDELDFSMLTSSAVMITLSGNPDTTNGFSGYVAGAVTLGNSGTNGFTGINHIIGSGSTSADSFTGVDGASTFSLVESGGNAADTYSVNAVMDSGNPYNLRLDSIESYVGGSDVDTFNVERDYSGDLAGGTGSGNDQFNFNSGTASGMIDGGDGADEFTFSGGTASGMIDGGAGADEFTFSGGTVSGMIDGGAGADEFIFNGGAVSSAVTGGTGADVLDFSMLTSSAVMVSLSGNPDTTNGFSGYVAGAVTLGNSGTNGFTGINHIVGSSSTSADSFTGVDGASTFSLVESGGSAADTYSVNSVMDSGNPYNLRLDNIESYVGGSDVDTFNVERSYSGSIDGVAGADVLDFSTLTSAAVMITLSGNPDTTNGFSGYVAGAVTLGNSGTNGFTGINHIVGSSSTSADSFTGVDGASTFSLVESGGNAVDTYSVNAVMDSGNPYNLRLDSIESYVGGSDVDTFNVARSYSGSIDGVAGADVLDFSTLTSAAVMITLSGNPDTTNGFSGYVAGAVMLGNSGTNGFTGINHVVGSGSTSADSFTGVDGASTFSLVESSGNAADTYSVNAVMDSGNPYNLRLDSIESYVGGSGNDIFNVERDYSGDLAGGTGSGNDQFNFNSGTASGMIDGGDGADEFTFSGGTVSGMIDGGADADEFTFSSGTVSGMIDGGAGADEFTFSGGTVSGTVAGGADNDTFILTAAVAGNVSGGDGNDTFEMEAGGSVTGTVAGGADGRVGTDTSNPGDTLTYTKRSTPVEVTVAATPDGDGFAGTATATGGFTGIDTIIGGTGTADTFRGASDGSLEGNTYNTPVIAPHEYALTLNNFDVLTIPNITGTDVATTWTITGNMVTEEPTGGATRTFMDVSSIYGGSADDTFNINGRAASSVMLILNGGDGSDTLGFADIASGDTRNTVGIALTGTPGAMGFSGDASIDNGADGTFVISFSGVDNIVGDTNAGDTLQGLDAAATWNFDATNTYVSADGGGVDRTLTFSNLEDIQGGSMADSLNFARISDALTITLTDTPDADGFGGEVSNGVDFTGINEITGGSVNDTLEGLGADATWNIGATDTYVSADADGVDRTLTLSAIEFFVGGEMADTFNIERNYIGLLDGEDGDNIFRFRGGSVSAGNINGEDIGNDVAGVSGKGGSDTLDFSHSSIVALTIVVVDAASSGFDGTIALTSGIGTLPVSRFSSIDSITGSGMNDTMNGTMSSYRSMSPDTVTVTATWKPGSYTVTDTDDNMFTLGMFTLGISSVEIFQGSNQPNVTADILDLSDVNAALTIALTGTRVDGGFHGNVSRTDTMAFPISSFTNMNTIRGGMDNGDTLTGLDAAADWTLGDMDSYVIDDSGTDITLMFSSLETIVGGSMADTFTINRAYTGSIMGKGGADTFNLESGGSVSMDISGGAGADEFNFNGGTVSGTVVGAAGDDVLDFSMLTSSAVMITLSGDPDTTNGFSGYVAGAVTLGNSGTNGFTGINHVVGSGSTSADSFTGVDGASTFSLVESGGSAADTYSVNAFMDSGNPYNLRLDSIESYVGGSGNDIFNVERDYNGDLAGGMGSGNDQFNFNSGTVSGTVTGGAGDDTFTFDGGTVSGTVTGGAGDDTFTFDGGTVSGTVTGGARGTTTAGDTLVFSSGVTNALAITLSGVGDSDGFDGSITVTGGTLPVPMFEDINTITGNSATTDTLTGRDADDNMWTLGTTDSYTSGGQILMFSDLENIQGGAMADAFTINGVHSGNIMGGAGADSFTLTGAVTGSLSGGDGDDTFALNSGGSVSVNVTGGAGDDTFTFNGGTVSGMVQGGARGTTTAGDTLVFSSGVTNALAITLSEVGDSDGFDGMVSGGPAFTFEDINIITGNSATTDTLTGLNADNMWTLGATDSYTSGGQTLRFSDLETIVGGSGDDIFNVARSYSGSINGVAGADVLDFSTLTSAAVMITLSGNPDTTNGFSGYVAGAVMLGNSGTNGFTGINHVVGSGSTSADSFTGVDGAST